jgi:hypothetical protein
MEQENPQHRKVSKPVAALAALGLAAGLGWTLLSGFKNPPTSVVTSSNAVAIDWSYRGVCGELTVVVDGQPVPMAKEAIQSGLAQATFPVPVGEHQAVVTFHSIIPGLSRDYPLAITVDQQAPELTAAIDEAPKDMVTTDERITLSGKVESGAQLFLESEPLTIDQDGQFQQAVTLSPGWNHLLLSAIDPAGNKTNTKFSLFRDTQDPEIVWQTRPDEVYEKTFARLEMDLTDDGEVVGVSGKVNEEQPVTWHAKGNGHWVGVTPDLHEGFHEVSVKAVDKSGRVVTSKRQIVINSSEALGDAVLGLGARGEDVRLLHERLVEAGYMAKDSITDVFNKTTETALEKLQEAEGYEVTGMAEGKTLIALGPRIFINLSNFSLVLDRPGKNQRRWMIASGSWAHPTPVGEFIIKEKVMHPTWLPPKSDWAKDAKPIPPGPGNPLGTRWMGFDWGGVGIHGTNAPWSIGSASSHGCMRMVTGQAEELFELVEVGTPVVVLGGWEKSPALERYWPKKPDGTGEESEEPEEVAKT